MQFLPREQEVKGWKLESDPLVLPAGELRSYMEQEADHFQKYGVIDMTVGQYQRTTNPPGAAVVEIFRFPDFIKAFGAYSTRRTAVVNFLDIGNESFAGPHSLHIWRGPFYVRVSGPSAQMLDPMKELASAVAERMPQAPGKPAVLGFLPDKYRVINSEVFTADAAFGHPVLANSFMASFNVDGDAIDGLVLPANTKEEAATILNKYKAFFGNNGRLLDPIINLGEDNFTGEDHYLGRTVAFRLDRFVVVFRGFRDKQKLVDLAVTTDQRILGTIRKQLVKADEAKKN